MAFIPPDILLQAYSQGYFPMSDDKDDDDVAWYEPKLRGIIPMHQFKVSKNVRKLIRQRNYSVRVDSNFEKVIRSCADRESTWISDVIVNSYLELFKVDHAHSVEVYNMKDELVGGLYGVSLGAAFFGESMFKYEKEMDKIALYFCHQHLQAKGFKLWDTQFYTDHLGRFGAIEIHQEDYLDLLDEALSIEPVPTF